MYYRSEAKTVPNLLVAPISPTVPSKQPDLYADYPQGYYSDGAYTATPLPHSNTSQRYKNGEQQDDKDPQDAYYTSLCARFAELTEVLQSPPPRAAPNSTDVYYLDWRKTRLWRGKILKTRPTMILLTMLTQDSVVYGLEVLESLLTLANLRGKMGKNIGAWTWGLLGKCREVGQMGSEEVGVLRKLGKQATWLLRRISAGEVIGEAADEPDVNASDEEGEEDDDDEEDVQGDGDCVEDVVDADGGCAPYIDPITTAALGQDSNSEACPVATMSDADLEKAKQHILDSLANTKAQMDYTDTDANNKDGTRTPVPTCPVTESEVDGEGSLTERAEERATIHATLDMFVTIIGEFYGQRDLLDGRLLWDEMQ